MPTCWRIHANPVIRWVTNRKGKMPHAHYEQRGRHSLPAECTPTQSVSSCPLQAERETLTICRVHTNPVSVIMPITSREGDTHSLQSAHQPSQCHHAHYKQRETLTDCRVHTNPVSVIMPITSRAGDTHQLQSAHQPSQCHHAHYKQTLTSCRVHTNPVSV